MELVTDKKTSSEVKAEESSVKPREVPYSLEAERHLLGVLLINNENVNKVADFLNYQHFYVPIHAKIYEFIIKIVDKGMVANSITVKNYIDSDDFSKQYDINLMEYLIGITAESMINTSVISLAKVIYDSYLRRRLIDIGSEVIRDACDINIDHDPVMQLEHAEASLFNLATEGNAGQDNVTNIRDSIAEVLNRIEKAKKNSGGMLGVDTGFVLVNDLLGGGMQRSDLIIIAARPSMGKTALAINIAINAANSFNKNKFNKQSVCFFSLEMSSEQIAARVMSIKSQVDSAKIRTAKISVDDFIELSNSMNELEDLPLYIDDSPFMSISALRTKARRMKRQKNVGLIVVDYLQLLRGNLNSDNRVHEIGEITNGLKAIAKELDIPVVALSQLSRAVETREDKRPQLSDLRESGNIEQDADVVAFIYREEYYLMRKKPVTDPDEFLNWQREIDKIKNIAEVIFSKHRNGPIGTVSLYYDNNTTVFKNLDYSNMVLD